MNNQYYYAETLGDDTSPIIFTFHGTGDSEEQFHDLASTIVPEAHVISPRGDVLEHSAARFFKYKAEGVYDIDDLAQRTQNMIEFLRTHRACLNDREVWAMGYSNGANILASVLFEKPTLFDRVALFHPLIPWQPAPNPALHNLRVMITAGRRDPMCSPAHTQALAAYFNEQGVALDTVWHEGGHEIDSTEIEALRAFWQAE